MYLCIYDLIRAHSLIGIHLSHLSIILSAGPDKGKSDTSLVRKPFYGEHSDLSCAKNFSDNKQMACTLQLESLQPECLSSAETFLIPLEAWMRKPRLKRTPQLASGSTKTKLLPYRKKECVIM